MNILKTVKLFDERDQLWYDIYTTPGIAGEPITVEVPRDVREPCAVYKSLMRAGAELPPFACCKLATIEAIESDAPITRRTARVGWCEDGSCFVDPRHVAGSATLLPPSPSSLPSAANIGCCGDLEAWQDLVTVAQHSQAMLVSLCAAFAAPFLGPLQRPNFGITLVGDTRLGKSTAQLMGASVIGLGEEEHLPTLRATGDLCSYERSGRSSP